VRASRVDGGREPPDRCPVARRAAGAAVVVGSSRRSVARMLPNGDRAVRAAGAGAGAAHGGARTPEASLRILIDR